MDSLSTDIGFVGSVASIIGWIMSWKYKDKTRNKIMYFIIFILSGLTALTFHLYKEETDKRLKLENRKQEVRLEAQNMLKSYPNYISYYEPGENEGVLYGTLVLLEKNKDIFPETYELYKKDVIQKIEKSNRETDIFRRREQMEIAGKAAMQFLKLLAQ